MILLFYLVKYIILVFSLGEILVRNCLNHLLKLNSVIDMTKINYIIYNGEPSNRVLTLFFTIDKISSVYSPKAGP